MTDNNQSSTTVINEDDTANLHPSPLTFNEDHSYSPQQQCKTTQRNSRWSEKEKSLVVEFFSYYIKHSKNPGTAKCKEFLTTTPSITGRTWMQVNSLVNNLYTGKTHLPLQYRYLKQW